MSSSSKGGAYKKISGSRVSAPRLFSIKSQLAAQHELIVKSVYDCRLITTPQLQRLLISNKNFEFKSERTFRRTLNKLVNLKILVRLNRKIGGAQAGSSGYIYTLGSIGARLMSDDRLHAFVANPSEFFHYHSLAISEIYVRLHEQYNQGIVEELKIETEPSCWRPFMGYGANRLILKPDMYVSVAYGPKIYVWFLELDRDTERSSFIFNKAKLYEKYYFSGYEEQRTGSTHFPRVMWIVPSEARAKKILKYVEPIERTTPYLCNVTVMYDGLVEQMTNRCEARRPD